ncbi:MAG: DUF1345 domain-containing protein [Galactobacter sp.]|uniref:DUF1345 domain-containing protein n=1 Tax=Galactobacter sp. TaxID=2676125 RepID=UPI0025C62521|nr:DUF1345 domain-containing protein [Galactobacter sp.]
MATRYVTDLSRANWSVAVATAVGAVAAWILAVTRGPVGDREEASLIIDFYMIMWVSFTAVYLVWTHLAYSRRGPQELRVSARTEQQRGRRVLMRVMGYGGPSSWTMGGAIVAIIITLWIAQSPSHREQPFYIIMGIVIVACSWALMAYGFALEYLRLAMGSSDEVNHLELAVEDGARFGDYLTLAVMASAMGSTDIARVRSRTAWTVVRTNVILGFAFNSVIVAMMVSLLIGGLSS